MTELQFSMDFTWWTMLNMGHSAITVYFCWPGSSNQEVHLIINVAPNNKYYKLRYQNMYYACLNYMPLMVMSTKLPNCQCCYQCMVTELTVTELTKLCKFCSQESLYALLSLRFLEDFWETPTKWSGEETMSYYWHYIIFLG